MAFSVCFQMSKSVEMNPIASRIAKLFRHGLSLSIEVIAEMAGVDDPNLCTDLVSKTLS